jgi:hypothetical protein
MAGVNNHGFPGFLMVIMDFPNWFIHGFGVILSGFL